MNEPVVDILLATYNGERFVAKQIESIQCQTYLNWQLHISDDCSSDGTLDIVSQYAEKDHRIKIVSEGIQYGSAKANFIHLLSITHSNYVMFCDQDDVWLPQKIETLMQTMKEEEIRYGNATPLLVFCDMKVVDSDLHVIAESFEARSRFNTKRIRLENLISLNIAAGCSMLLNSELASRCLCFVDVNKIEMHDWWVMIVASVIGHIRYVNNPLVLYRQHGKNEVGSQVFSPIRRASQYDFLVSQMVSTFRQAQLLLESYDKELAADQRAHLSAYCMIETSNNAIKSLILLFKSRCLKEWPRCLGQLYVAAKIAFINACVLEGGE